MGKIKLLIEYLIYRLNRKGARGHGIHSPFIYDFNRNVLNSSEKYPEYIDIGNYRRNLLRNRETIKVDDRGAGSVVFSSSQRRISDIVSKAASSYRMGKLLFRLARHLQPETTVELGTSVGFGTVCLAKGAETGRVYSLEACAAQVETARHELGNAGVRNAELLVGPFSSTLPELTGRLDKIDLVYMDGDHRKEAVLWQFRKCREKASHGTVFVVADIYWSDDMTRAWKILCRDTAVTVSVDLFFCGLLFLRKGIAKQHFILGFSD